MPEPVCEQAAASRRAARGHILFTIGVLLLLLLAWTLRKELVILYVSALFAAVLTPLVTGITRLSIRGRSPSRSAAILILLLIAAIVLGLFFFVDLPPVLRDLSSFARDFPHRIPNILARVHRLPLVSRINLDWLAANAESFLTTSATYLVTSLPQWLTHLFDIFTAAFLCLYFMLEGDHVYRFFLSLFSHPQRERLDRTLQRAHQRVSRWLLGQGLLMLILGACSTLVFGLLHVRYFLMLGFLMGLFNIIPVAGGIITVCLAAGVAALDSWPKMLGVLVFYIVYVNVENAYLTPRIMRSSVDLMGLTILIALLFGTALAGVTGALVAVPTAALVAVLLEEYALHREEPEKT